MSAEYLIAHHLSLSGTVLLYTFVEANFVEEHLLS